MSIVSLFWFVGAVAFGLGAYHFWRHRRKNVLLFGDLSLLFLLIGIGFLIWGVA